MRLMIVGQKYFAAEVLALCLEQGHDVAAVSAPRVDDRLAAAATAAGIPLCQVAGRFGPEWMPDGLDLVVCAHAHVFITAEARRKARLGAIGYHPSLLPRHRGRDAVHWAIHMGDPVTGGTLYWLDDGADTGDIAAQDWCWVRPGDSPAQLWRRDLAPIGLRLLAGTLARLEAGEVPRLAQDPAMATWEPGLSAGRLGRG